MSYIFSQFLSFGLACDTTHRVNAYREMPFIDPHTRSEILENRAGWVLGATNTSVKSPAAAFGTGFQGLFMLQPGSPKLKQIEPANTHASPDRNDPITCASIAGGDFGKIAINDRVYQPFALIGRTGTRSWPA